MLFKRKIKKYRISGLFHNIGPHQFDREAKSKKEIKIYIKENYKFYKITNISKIKK